MTFREFFAARWGAWPVVGQNPPEGYPTWDGPMFETMGDYLDIIGRLAADDPVTQGLLLSASRNRPPPPK